MEIREILDVTLLEPRLKHPTIFQRFDALYPGASFVIHNDHDPKPLYYQLLGERGKVFRWKYLKEGPDTWKVEIGKLVPGEKENTIGELVAKDLRRAEVFRKYGIDFCCGGKKTLSAVCLDKGLDIVQVESELISSIVTGTTASQDYDSWELDFLADYIIHTHHKYVTRSIPVIEGYLQKVIKSHGEKHPEVLEIASSFRKIADELKQHMIKEEQVLFPWLKIYVHASQTHSPAAIPPFRTIKHPIEMMEAEHTLVGEEAERIQTVSGNFQPPPNSCVTFQVAYASLQEFMDDLRQHIHLENNILFPKAIALEKELSTHTYSHISPVKHAVPFSCSPESKDIIRIT